jgi:hypothetical protein
MMRPLRALLVALVAAAAVPALAIGALDRAAPAPVRVTPISLFPVVHDVAMAEFRFARSGSRALSAANVHLAMFGRFGAEYVALAAPPAPEHGGDRALLIMVGKRRAPAGFAMRLRSSRALGPVGFHGVATVFASSFMRSPPRPGACDLTQGGTPLEGSSLRILTARGTPPRGFTATGAVAASYDAACGLPFPLAYKQLFRWGPGCEPDGIQDGSLCCPPGSPCAPPAEAVPTPPPVPEGAPVPSPPGPKCPPCNPAPGHACPLAASPAACVAGTAERTPRSPY